MVSKKKTETSKAVELKLNRVVMIILVLLSVVGLFYVYSISKNVLNKKYSDTTASSSGKKVDVGDVVAINYVGRFLNGTSFDTSIEQVAVDEGIYSDGAVYRPLTFTVGESQILKGIDDGVVGMAEGEKKVIVVPPELGFGEYNPALVQVSNRTYAMDSISNISLERFMSVVSSEPVVNTTITDPEIPWPMFILNVTDDAVTIRYSPEAGSQVETLLGLADVVNISSDKIWVRENPVNGSLVMTTFGPARVLDFNATSIVLDFNNLAAGKTLIYEVTVEGVMKMQPA